jgi:hypothetical protein
MIFIGAVIILAGFVLGVLLPRGGHLWIAVAGVAIALTWALLGLLAGDEPDTEGDSILSFVLLVLFAGCWSLGIAFGFAVRYGFAGQPRKVTAEELDLERNDSASGNGAS